MALFEVISDVLVYVIDSLVHVINRRNWHIILGIIIVFVIIYFLIIINAY